MVTPLQIDSFTRPKPTLGLYFRRAFSAFLVPREPKERAILRAVVTLRDSGVSVPLLERWQQVDRIERRLAGLMGCEPSQCGEKVQRVMERIEAMQKQLEAA